MNNEMIASLKMIYKPAIMYYGEWELLSGLDKTEFIDRIKTAQINWIGKSIGAEVDFKIKDFGLSRLC